jgi:hypothetical protein
MSSGKGKEDQALSSSDGPPEVSIVKEPKEVDDNSTFQTGAPVIGTTLRKVGEGLEGPITDSVDWTENKSVASAESRTFVGLGKEELLPFVNDPFWIKLRWTLWIAYWLLVAALLVAAIVLIVEAAKEQC